MWERSFVAVSVLIDTSHAALDEALGALSGPGQARSDVVELARELRDPRRSVRARGMAAAAQDVAMALAAVTLR